MSSTPRDPLNPKLKKLAELIETVRRLRAPGGCPWDIAQTHQSLRQYLIEEAYEVLDVLDRIDTPESLAAEDIRSSFKEELGDLLLQVVLHAEITAQEKVFDIYDVAEFLNEKLLRRHPHVFGDVKVDGAEAAFKNWEKLKAKEKSDKIDASILDGVPRGLPSLQRAGRVIEKVTKVGFQWPDMQGPLAKVEEELKELKAEVLKLEKMQSTATSEEIKVAQEKLSAELGDVFFTLANVAHLMKISPEDSLRSTLKRFENRFKYVERKLKEQGKTPEQSTLKEMDVFWDEAKALERNLK